MKIKEEFKTIGIVSYYADDDQDDHYGIPEYGNWDPMTGKWKNTNVCNLSEGYDDEIDYQWVEDFENLKAEIKTAYHNGDYDLAMELEDDLESLEFHYEEDLRSRRGKKLGF